MPWRAAFLLWLVPARKITLGKGRDGLTSKDCSSFSQAFVLDPAPSCLLEKFTDNWAGCTCEVPQPPRLQDLEEPLPCPFASACEAEVECLDMAAFGFSEVQMGVGALQSLTACSYLMAPGQSFSMPETVASFRGVMAFQEKPLGQNCGGMGGFKPSQSMADVCRRALYRLQASCDATWKAVLPAGCQDVAPPYGFNEKSTLRELCPVDCAPSLDFNALHGVLAAREEQRQQALEAERQKELLRKLEQRTAGRKQAQAEAKKHDAAGVRAQAAVREALKGSPLEKVASTPEVTEALAATPGAAEALADPSLAKALAANPDLLAAMSKSPELSVALANPDLVKGLAANPELMSSLGQRPELAMALSKPGLAKLALSQPEISAALLKDPQLATAIGKTPALASALVKSPDGLKAVQEVAANPDLLAAVDGRPELAAALVDKPEKLKVIASSGSVDQAIQEDPELSQASKALTVAPAPGFAVRPAGLAFAPAAAVAASPFAAPIPLRAGQKLGKTQSLKAEINDLQSTVQKLQDLLDNRAPAPAPAPM